MKTYLNNITKTILICIIAFLILLFSIGNTYAASKTILKYDIDNNNKIEKTDATKILRHIVAKKTNTNSEWMVDQNLDLRGFLAVMRYLQANENNSVAQKHSDWLNLIEEIVLNVKNSEEKLNLITNKEVKIQIDGKNYGTPKYESKDRSIADVSSSGVITAKGKGNTIITVYDERKVVSEKVNVSVSDEREEIQLNKEQLVLDVSDKNQEKLEATGVNEGTLTWGSSDNNVAEVDQEGNVQAKGNGECKIIVTTSKGNKAECSVTVQTSPSKIELEKEEVSLVLSGENQYKIRGRILPETANVNKEVTYNSSNTEIATVDSEGKITAVAAGTTNIEVTTKNGKKATCKVNVVTDEKIPTVTIRKLYDGNIITAGNDVNYEITVDTDTITSIDESKITGKGSLVKDAKYKITGNDKSYNLLLKVPEKEGTIGIVIEEGFVKNNSGKTNAKTESDEQKVFKLDTTATSNAITAAVGVINSFYVKDYDFYINNESKVTGRTTNEYTFDNLQEGNTYKIKVHVNVYKNKETDDIIEGWLEKDVKTTKNNGAEIHFINVTKRVPNSDTAGAADCIFIKTSGGKTIMIDTGAETNNSGYVNFVSEIDKYLRVDKKGKDGNTLVKEENGIVNIDYLVLTHNHRDHVGGFQDLTGVLYKQSSPGYMIDENNTINDKKVRYDFGKVILGCNHAKYEPDQKIGNVQDGAKQNNTTAAAIEKAMYCYSKDNNKIMTVNAGNTLKIDDTVLNIYNPYPEEDVPKEWRGSIRKSVNIYYSGGNLSQADFSEENNNSVIIKLLNGSRKALLMGDGEFVTEEILLGIPAKQIKENSRNRNEGLKVDSSNGGNADSEKTTTDYTCLIDDLLTNNYGGCSSIEELEAKYKISRLTAKDMSAQILKKGHHGVANTTSIPFLSNVKPSKIVSTGESSDENYKNSIIGCVNTGPDYCIRSYYNSDNSRAEAVEALNFNGGKIKLTNNNWYYFVFGTDNVSKTDGNDKGKGSFCIYTSDGISWNYSKVYGESIKGGASYSSLNLSQSDMNILYKLVEAEGGGGTHKQVMYLACTILNRVLSSSFPDTMQGVAFQSGQFEVTWNGMYDAAVPTNETKAAVDEALSTGDITGGSIGFQNDWLYDSQYPNQTWETPIELLRETWPYGGVVVFFTTKSIQEELSQYS